MPLPLLAQLGISAAPTAIKGLNELINPSQASAYEQKLAQYAEVLGGQASSPITQNRVFTEGKSVIDQRDKQNRESVTNVVGAGNVTNEAKLAGMDDANDAYTAALNRLMSNAQRFREYSQGQYMNVLGAQEQAKQSRLAQRQANTASWLGPLSDASSAFLLADATGGKKGFDPSKVKDPVATGGPASSGSLFDIIDYKPKFA